MGFYKDWFREQTFGKTIIFRVGVENAVKLEFVARLCLRGLKNCFRHEPQNKELAEKVRKIVKQSP